MRSSRCKTAPLVLACLASCSRVHEPAGVAPISLACIGGRLIGPDTRTEIAIGIALENTCDHEVLVDLPKLRAHTRGGAGDEELELREMRDPIRAAWLAPGESRYDKLEYVTPEQPDYVELCVDLEDVLDVAAPAVCVGL